MSAVIRSSTTPFLNRKQLIEALESMDCLANVQGDLIYVNIRAGVGQQAYFQTKKMGRFSLIHRNNTTRNVNSFLSKVDKAYQQVAKNWRRQAEELKLQAEQEARIDVRRALELEKQQLEAEERARQEEKKAYIAQKKAEIIQKAKAKGYEVREYAKGEKIQLQLVKVSY